MGFLNIFKKKNKAVVEESFIKTEVIYNSNINFMVLISFSKDKLNDAVEFMSDVSKVDIQEQLYVLYRHSSYEEETDRKDDKGYQIYNIYDRYYILISGTNLGYRTLFRRSDNIGNDILVELANDISNNRHHEIFQELIDDGIFNNYFVSASPGKHSIETDGLAENAIKLKTDTYAYDDIEYIKKQLPKCFSMQSLLPMVRVYKKNDFSVSVKSFIDYIIQNIDHKQYYSKKEFYEAAKEFIDIISPISTEETIIDDLSILIGPQYLVPELDDDDGISDAELDEIFREKYERFTGVADSNIEYEDIDEELSKEPIYDEGEDNNADS